MNRHITVALAEAFQPGMLRKPLEEWTPKDVEVEFATLECDLATGIVRLPGGFSTTVTELEGAVTMIRSLQAELLAQTFRE